MTARTVDPIYAPFTITTPIGTLPSAPQSTTLLVPHGKLLTVDLLVPPGHAGTTGFRLELSRQAILPYQGVNNWIIGDGLQETFAANIEVDTLLVAVTYNQGNYVHSHFVRLQITQRLDVPIPGALELLPHDQIG